MGKKLTLTFDSFKFDYLIAVTLYENKRNANAKPARFAQKSADLSSYLPIYVSRYIYLFPNGSLRFHCRRFLFPTVIPRIASLLSFLFLFLDLPCKARLQVTQISFAKKLFTRHFQQNVRNK